jgi:hypothetical protein
MACSIAAKARLTQSYGSRLPSGKNHSVGVLMTKPRRDKENSTKDDCANFNETEYAGGVIYSLSLEFMVFA